MRILLVEDDPDLSRQLKLAVEAMKVVHPGQG